MGVYSDLKDKRVIITGAASGIGLATAQRFLSEGSRVVIFDWDQAALDRIADDLPGLSGAINVDVSDPPALREAFVDVDKLLGGIDVLISNAGISARKPFLELAFEQWQRVLRVNLDSMFLCAQEAIKRMRPQRSGVILFMGSTNGLEGHPLYADYNASKAGVIVLAKTLALEFAPWLRANAVCPGYVLTPMQESEYTEEELAEVNADIPLNRHATPAEIAGLFAYLASQESAFITGQAIAIDGGETSGIFLKGLES